MKITNYNYYVELLTPRIGNENALQEGASRFSRKYRRILEAGCGVSIPDNPMGRPRQRAIDSINLSSLPVDPERTIFNINTFHTIFGINHLLKEAAERGVRYLLVVRGDGGPDLPRLEPKSIGAKKNIVTTMDLLRYIHSEFRGTFVTGVAFNQYKPVKFEIERLKRKLNAGAEFIITQPVIGRDAAVDEIDTYGYPVIVEAWMSKKVDLLFKSVGSDTEKAKNYDPIQNLHLLHRTYPSNVIYLSMLDFNGEWEKMLPCIQDTDSSVE